MSFKRRPPAGNVRRVSAIGNNARGTLTNKAGRIVQFESFAERSLLLRLDRDQTVQDYVSQPEQFRGLINQNRQQVYTPDFMVWRKNGAIEIHEVTRTERRFEDKARIREEMAQTICHDRGWTYHVHTETDLPQGTELANLLSLLRYRPTGYRHEAIVASTMSYLVAHSSISLNNLSRKLWETATVSRQIVNACLCHLLWHDELATDWQQAIFLDAGFAASTIVWMPSRVTHEQSH